MAVPAQRELIRVSHDWDAWRRETACARWHRLKLGLDDAVARMTRGHARRARRSRRSIAGLRRAGATRRSETKSEASSSISATARSRGRASFVRRSIRRATASRIVATQFYLAFQVVQRRADRRAVEVALLDAAPPADRLSFPLARGIAAACAPRRIRLLARRAIPARVPRCSTTRSDLERCSTCAPRRSYKARWGSASPRPPARARGLAFLAALGLLRDRRVARDATSDASRCLARHGARMHGARAAQPILEPDAAVRSGVLLHAARRSAHRKRRRAVHDERARAARSSRRLSPANASCVAVGGDRRRSCSSRGSGRFFFASSRAAFRFRCTASARGCG